MNHVETNPPLTSLALQIANVLVVVLGAWLAFEFQSAAPDSVPLQWSGEEASRFGSPRELWVTPGILIFDL